MLANASIATRRNRRTDRTTAGLALLLTIGLFGCGTGDRVADPVPSGPLAASGGVTSPGSEASGRDRSVDAGDRRPTTVPNPITNIVITDQELIGPDGGKVKAGLFELDIPEGALTAPVLISVGDYSGVTGRIECELLPHGLQFQTAVELTVKLPDSVKPEGITLFWVANEGLPTEFWAPMPTRTESGGGRIIADLTHFSRYAPGQTDGKAGWQKLPGRGGQTVSLTGDDRRP